MDQADAVAALAALAQETRLDIFRCLVQQGPAGLAAGQIGERFGLPSATLSFHLKTLKQAGLVDFRRAGRSLIYRADFEAMSALLAYLTENCCGGDPGLQSSRCFHNFGDVEKTSGENPMNPAKTYNVLFLCTGNSARSQLAEAILNRAGRPRFRAYSAGSHPSGTVHPLALQLLRHLNFPSEELRSKSWNEFAAPGAPPMDFVFTVCANAAGETCPVWPGQPMTAHWGVDDPVAAEGSEAGRMQAFREAFRILERRIEIFVNLPIERLDRLKLQRRLDEIGRSQSEPAEAGKS